jgi:hypothetical protein
LASVDVCFAFGIVGVRTVAIAQSKWRRLASVDVCFAFGIVGVRTVAIAQSKWRRLGEQRGRRWQT